MKPSRHFPKSGASIGGFLGEMNRLRHHLLKLYAPFGGTCPAYWHDKHARLKRHGSERENLQSRRRESPNESIIRKTKNSDHLPQNSAIIGGFVGG